MAYRQLLFFLFLFNIFTSSHLFSQDPQLSDNPHPLVLHYLANHQYIQAELVVNKVLSNAFIWKEENKDLLKILLKDLAFIYASTGRMQSAERVEVQIKMLEVD